MELVRLHSGSFRNLSSAALDFASGVNLVLGANGQGKSNLLEALTVLGSLRSFRRARARHMVQHDGEAFSLSGELQGSTSRVRLGVTVEVGPPLRQRLTIDGLPTSVADYLATWPVFSFSAADRDLVSGSPQGRRSLLDRFAFLLRPVVWDDLRVYRRCLVQRNAALGGPEAVLEAWDTRLAEAAARVVTIRRAAVARLREAFAGVYPSLAGADFPNIELGYREETWLSPSDDPGEVAKQYEIRYDETRARDRERGFTGAGPHRHDLTIHAHGRAARDLLSAGQVKVVAAALGMAALEQVEATRGERLPVVVDDVDAELDSEVQRRFVQHLGRKRQLFLSSAHEEMVRLTVRADRCLRMASGRCTAESNCGERE